MKKQKGFSLIELLIVVAIILIIAAIAIPNLLRSRMAANEASAVGSVRTIATSEITYQTTNPQAGFTDLAVLGPNAGAGANLIDQSLASGTKSGYNFGATGNSPDANGVNQGFVADSRPVTVGQTGNREFCAYEDAVVRFVSPAPNNTVDTAAATCTSATSALNN